MWWDVLFSYTLCGVTFYSVTVLCDVLVGWWYNGRVIARTPRSRICEMSSFLQPPFLQNDRCCVALYKRRETTSFTFDESVVDRLEIFCKGNILFVIYNYIG